MSWDLFWIGELELGSSRIVVINRNSHLIASILLFSLFDCWLLKIVAFSIFYSTCAFFLPLFYQHSMLSFSLNLMATIWVIMSQITSVKGLETSWKSCSKCIFLQWSNLVLNCAFFQWELLSIWFLLIFLPIIQLLGGYRGGSKLFMLERYRSISRHSHFMIPCLLHFALSLISIKEFWLMIDGLREISFYSILCRDNWFTYCRKLWRLLR